MLARARWATGDHDGAVEMMDSAIAASPVVEREVVERMWTRDRWKGESVALTAEEMARYVGQYGQRQIVVEEGSLAYFRGSNDPATLVPVGENQFMVSGLDFFRLEVVFDAEGHAEKIVGYYSGGNRDESPRTDRAAD